MLSTENVDNRVEEINKNLFIILLKNKISKAKKSECKFKEINQIFE
jgi:hypothetical protein